MTKPMKGSFALMKQLNISAILEVLRIKRRISRAEIAQITGLTPASVTNITKELMKSGFVQETGIGESSGGRPPVILELNPDAGYVVGVNFGPGIIEAVVTNLDAKIMVKKACSVDTGTQQYVIGIVEDLIADVIKDKKVPEDSIIGIGLAIHGITNIHTGVLEFAPYYQWRGVRIKDIIEEKFGYPVFIENDVRAMALAESWFGVARGIPNFITVSIANGVGAGIIMNGKPYYGVDYSAGEIGHIVVEPDGPKCTCGNYGCLESLASDISLIKKAVKMIRQGAKTKIIELCNGNEENINIETIVEAAKQGDNLAVSIIEEAGRYIGITVSNLVNILNPNQFVLVGDITNAGSILIESIKATVRKVALEYPAKNIKIVNSALKKDAPVIGGATLVLQEIFKGEELTK